MHKLLAPLSFAAGLAIAVSSVSGASVSNRTYTDVNSTSPYAPAIDSLSKQGVVEGYADGTFRPTARINRAEFLKITMLAAGHTTTGEANVKCFTDFRGAEQWYWKHACEAKAQGIIHGYPDGTFGGTRNINLAEALKMTMHAFNVPLPQYFREPDNWYDPYMDAAAGLHLFTHITRDPAHLITRGEVAVVVDTAGGGKKCISSDQCAAGQYCTTEDGDCQSACPPNAEACIQVCAGVCKDRPVSGGPQSCSDEEDAFNDVVVRNRSCQSDSDCTMFEQSCPYVTCGVAINTSAEDDARVAADAYVSCIEKSGGPISCAACLAQRAVCRNSQCTLVEREL